MSCACKMPPGASPLDGLFQFQRDIVTDPARFKILNCARQCGKSTIFAFEAAMDCAAHGGTEWVALSRGERQVKVWMRKARRFAETWAAFCGAVTGEALTLDCSAEQIVFSNGSRITGIPANADTARGYSANLILDEFAYHEHADEIWAAVFPFISNEISEKFKLRIGSTVSGQNNKFWELFSRPSSETGFRKWRVTVHDAVADGMPIDVAALRRAISDADIWKQEYECIPVEGTTTLISRELIAAAQSKEAARETPFSAFDERGRAFFAGVDIGRKHDLTVVWIVERVGSRERSRLVTRAVIELRHADFETQQRLILGIAARRSLAQICVDATGIGAQLAETAHKRFPAKVEECTFSAPFKREIYLDMQAAFQAGTILIPQDGENDSGGSIAEDIHAVQRVYTSGGNLLFYAPTNDDGHSDRASALALAIRAAGRAEARSFVISSPNDGFDSVKRFLL